MGTLNLRIPKFEIFLSLSL